MNEPSANADWTAILCTAEPRGLPAPDDPAALHQWTRDLVDRIECFLAAQLHRLDGAMVLCRQSISEGQAARRLAAEVQQQQSSWIVQRDGEIQRLKEASDLLAQGWSQLEDERRELMKQQHTALAPAGTAHLLDRAPSPRQSPPTDPLELLKNVNQMKRELRQHAERHP